VPVVLVLPELLPVVVAVAAMLLLWASTTILVKPLIWLFSQIPVVGERLGDAIGGFWHFLTDWASTWAQQAIQPLVDAADWISGTIQYLARQAQAAVSSIYSSIVTVSGKVITLAGWAQAQVAALLTRAAATAASIAGLVAHNAYVALQLAAIVAVKIPGAVAQAVATAQAWAAAQLLTLHRALTAAIALVAAEARALLAAEAVARAGGDAAARAAAAAELLLAQRAIAAAMTALRTSTQVEVQALDHAIQGVQTQIGNWAIPATIAATITATMTEVIRIARCNDPMCSWLSPQLGILNLVEDGIMLAAVVELVQAAAHDPEGAARVAIADFEAVAGGVEGLLADLTGIRARAA
jgi:hypothetical protein